MNIFEALNILRSDLAEINNGKLPVTTMEGLDDASQSQQNFFNKDLFPADLPLPDDMVSDEERQDYSNKVLQAIWNIAAHTSKGYWKAILNFTEIKKSFTYLDKKTWVPKIIDERTYLVGKALQTFFENAVNDENLAIIPVKDVRDDLRKNLQSMENVLNQRITTYEAHRENVLKKSREALLVKKERLRIWHEEHGKFIGKLDELEQFVQENGRIMNSWFRGDDVASLKQRARLTDTLRKELQEAATTFAEFNSRWHEENTVLDLPDEIPVSRFILNLESGKDDPLQLWLELFNHDCDNLPTEKIRGALEDTWQDGNTDTADLEDNIYLMILNQHSSLFPAIIEAADELATFKEALQKHAEKLLDKEMPVLAFVDYETDEYHITLSEDPDPIECLEDNIRIYDKKIEVMQRHQQQLILFKRTVDTDFESNNPLPSSENEHLKGKRHFEFARTETRQTVLETISQRIALTQRLIDRASLEKNDLEDTLSRYSASKRQDMLQQAEARVHRAFNNMHDKSAKTEAQANHAYTQFMRMYNPAVKRIEAATMGISTHGHSLDQLEKKGKERREFLATAYKALQDYRDIINSHQGLYIPAALIPKEPLKAFLECNDGIGEFIDDVYETEREASGWGGFNRANFSNKLNHYTSIIGPSEFDWDLDTILEYVDEKISLIEFELQTDIRLSDIHGKPNVALLKKDHLWQLQTEYQSVQKKKDQFANQLEQEEPREQWERQKMGLEQRKAWATLQYRLDKTDHQLAMIALDCLRLDHKLLARQEAQDELTEIVENLASKNPEDALAFYEEQKERINTLQAHALLAARTDYRDKTDEELEKSTGWSLNSLQKELETLEKLVKDVNEPSEEQLAKQKRLQKEYRQLSDKQKHLKTSRQELNSSASKTIVELESILEEAGQSIARQPSEAESPVLRPELEMEIEEIEPIHEHASQTFQEKTDAIATHYFSYEENSFNDYLQKRAATFWLKDFFSHLLAMGLGCLGYKTDAQERAEYIDELNDAFTDYREAPDGIKALEHVRGETTNKKYLLNLIDYGLSHFSSRTEPGEEGYEASLASKLTAFKTDMEEADKLFPRPEMEEVEAFSFH
ncbi:hypothetical protein [Legionella spiritensis]|uniref:hypothetical protein n=1 Tax=Legionella spiritensis TaxID=452 RepID=UPI000F6E5699|nr:hypothetical protein [Legionella spiritensis]VEG91529.1 Uncharacterised protein [Legionella spiritensis]